MYQALYRKWRPLTFEDVVGQPHITTTLKNQIKSNKTAHAYLFTGSRGTGKTTCARIFAKTINCLNQNGGSPCLECEVCKASDLGTLNDIIEIDAASNTGVDDIRELRDSTAFTPEFCKYKVYIIDEVHMLSTSAFNALLKIMEEPPPHIKFILATTEVHKVPATIISRCQRFDFRRIQINDIVGRLEYISGVEHIELERNAATLIAKLSDGGMRDALSLLDQCVAYSQKVDLDTVSAAAGIAGRDYIFDLLDCIKENDPTKAIGIIDSLYDLSKDMQRLCEELFSQLRNIMIIKSVPNKDDLLTCLPDEIERLKTVASTMDLQTVLAKLSIIQECNERLPIVNSKRIEIEMCFVKLCNKKSFEIKQVSEGVNSEVINRLEKRIQKIESALASGEKITTTNVVKPTEPLVPQKQSSISEPAVDVLKLKDKDLAPVIDWSDIVDRIMVSHPEIGGFLGNSKGFEHQNIFFIIVDNDFFLKMFKTTDSAQIIQDALKDYFGKTYAIRVKSAKNVSLDDTENPINKLIEKAKNADIQVDIK